MITTLFEGAMAGSFVVVAVHGLRKYNLKKLALGFTAVGTVAYLEEQLAITVTQNYAYHGYKLMLGNVPLFIPLAWIVVAYVSYHIAKRTNLIIGASFGCLLDLLLEPLAYYTGIWTWYATPYPSINYFNAPIGNIIGWFILALVGAKILEKVIKEN